MWNISRFYVLLFWIFEFNGKKCKIQFSRCKIYIKINKNIFWRKFLILRILLLPISRRVAGLFSPAIRVSLALGNICQGVRRPKKCRQVDNTTWIGPLLSRRKAERRFSFNALVLVTFPSANDWLFSKFPNPTPCSWIHSFFHCLSLCLFSSRV